MKIYNKISYKLEHPVNNLHMRISVFQTIQQFYNILIISRTLIRVWWGLTYEQENGKLI